MAFGSGVAPSSECVDAFNELKTGRKLKYVIYKLNDTNTEIEVETKSDEADYDEFMNKLPESDCRYAVYDFEFDSGEGKRNKIAFIAWNPDNAKIKSRMVYTASKDALKNALNGISFELQATDTSEADEKAMLERCTRK